eukprot:CAMPEP_0174998390 /NCGR_PEP_ID=MMETSP0005-20121125/1482_1 /TAXON_ID=420556 /ORGANISM="Ochromonas sp., Strain CCMP1393" /LENGTH=50 /DNA_ID=CAMNT_0016253021 /DNA_START=935 /DNA_END=1087 /DNA_ORIENTATION=+
MEYHPTYHDTTNSYYYRKLIFCVDWTISYYFEVFQGIRKIDSHFMVVRSD